jgi:hypothetical protein
MPLPEVPLDEPFMPPLDEPLDEPFMPLDELPDWLLPLDLLLCDDDFFLPDLFIDDEPVDDEPMLDWSCAVALVPLDEPLPACAWAFMEPHIATTTDAPSRPFNTLFIFMSLS